MADVSKLELNIAVVDQDKLIREIREIKADARRARRHVAIAWFWIAVISVFTTLYVHNLVNGCR